jgi:hypothetical protein
MYELRLSFRGGVRDAAGGSLEGLAVRAAAAASAGVGQLLGDPVGGLNASAAGRRASKEDFFDVFRLRVTTGVLRLLFDFTPGGRGSPLGVVGARFASEGGALI